MPTGLLVTVGVLAAAVVVLAGFLSYRAFGHDNSREPGRSTPPAHGTNAQGGQGGRPSGTPTGTGQAGQQPAAPRLPAGWTTASGPGYTVGVPAGWQRSAQRRSVFWRDPNSDAYLQVDRTEWTGPPYEAWEQWESEVRANGSLKNYARIDLRRVTGTPYEAADIEFTWYGRAGLPMHGVDRHVLVDGRRYAVFVAVPASQWDAAQPQVNGFLDTFRP